MRDIERGEAIVEEGKTLRDYITEYQRHAQDDRVQQMVKDFGLDEDTLRELMRLHLTEANINEYGRFDKLKDTVDKGKARSYFEKQQGERVPPHKVNMQIDALLRRFLLEKE